MLEVPKVIHVVEAMNQQAVENWLLRMLRYAVDSGVKLNWTFYCTVGSQGSKDAAVRELGGHVVYTRHSLSEKRRFLRGLRRELRAGGYDILHCHHDIMSAPYLLASVGIPIRKRIVHVHNADLGLPTGSHLKKRLLAEPFRRICLTADHVVGNSCHTLDKMLGGRTRIPGRHSVHYYGVDPAPFAAADDRARLRESIGIAEDAKVLLFGGRMVPEKNPRFAVDVLAELRCRDPNAVAVFAGSGSEEQLVRDRARERGVADAVHMLGWRNDLPAVMAASDWFILPRPEVPMEGFGLAVVEAQLAGLRLLLSLGIADDPLLRTAHYRRLSLAEGAEAWAEAAMDLLNGPAPSSTAARAALNSSPMDMKFALNALFQLHTS